VPLPERRQMSQISRLGNPAIPAGILALALMVGVLAGHRPILGLFLAVAALFAVSIFVNLTAGLCLFIVLSFMEVLPDLGVPGLTVAKLVGLMLAVSWLGFLVVRRGPVASLFSAHPGFSYLLASFLGWSALSTLWADSSGPVGDATVRYGLNVLLLPIVFTAVRRREHMIWVLGAFALGASFAGLYGFAEPGSAGRLAGAAGDPNFMAASLVAGLVLAGALAAVLRRGSVPATLAVTAAVICGAGLLLSVSRGGLVALVVVLASAILLAGRRRALVGSVVVVVTLSAFVYFAAFASPEARERVTSVEGGTGRTEIWQIGWRMTQANPVTGVGAGNFKGSAVRYVLEPGALERTDLLIDSPRVAHNTYLQILAELGIIGLAMFLFIVGFSLKCAIRAVRELERRGDHDLELLARAILVATLGILAAGFFISANYINQLWLLLALGPAMLAVARGVPEPEQEPAGSIPPEPLDERVGAASRA
jgi:O-antigen ligase